jgi:hypothetical protein
MLSVGWVLNQVWMLENLHKPSLIHKHGFFKHGSWVLRVSISWVPAEAIWILRSQSITRILTKVVTKSCSAYGRENDATSWWRNDKAQEKHIGPETLLWHLKKRKCSLLYCPFWHFKSTVLSAVIPKLSSFFLGWWCVQAPGSCPCEALLWIWFVF